MYEKGSVLCPTNQDPADVLDMYDEQYLKKRREEVQRQKKLAQDLLVGRKKAEFKERKHPAH